MRLKALILCAIIVASPLRAEPTTPLKEVVEIRENLLAVGIAYMISEKCASIHPRLIKGVSFLYSIRSRARELGYSDTAIEAYVNSPEEKKALEIEGLRRLAEQGATADKPEAHCEVGRREIENKTLIGSFLW